VLEGTLNTAQSNPIHGKSLMHKDTESEAWAESLCESIACDLFIDE